MITTAEIQEFTGPLLEELFAALGHDLVIVRGGAATGGYDNDGRRQRTPDTRTPVRGLLMPADTGTIRAATDAGLPVPRYVAYLPFDPALDEPGWHLEHGGTAYHVQGDAQDPGGQGVLWVVPLAAPGEVTRGES